MAGERHVELAAEALRDAIAAGLDARLTAIETAQSLTPGSIPRPVEVVRARVPLDNRSPLISVYWERFNTTMQRQGLIVADCTIVVSAVGGAGPDDLAALEEFHGRYATALIDLIRGNSTLSGRVAGTELTDGEAAISNGDQAATRMSSAYGCAVRVQSP